MVETLVELRIFGLLDYSALHSSQPARIPLSCLELAERPRRRYVKNEVSRIRSRREETAVDTCGPTHLHTAVVMKLMAIQIRILRRPLTVHAALGCSRLLEK